MTSRIVIEDMIHPHVGTEKIVLGECLSSCFMAQQEDQMYLTSSSVGERTFLKIPSKIYYSLVLL